MAKINDPLPRLMHECARDIGLSILIGLGLMLASAVNAAAVNPSLYFQQDSQLVKSSVNLYYDCARQGHRVVPLDNLGNLEHRVEHQPQFAYRPAKHLALQVLCLNDDGQREF